MALQRFKSISRSRWSTPDLDGFGNYIRIAALAVAGVGVLVVGFVLFVYIDYALDSGRISQSIGEYREWLQGGGTRPVKPPIRIYARDGRTLIGEYLPERGSRINMRQCGELDWLKKAAVSAEDRAFFDHGGISYRGILRAVINNVRHLQFREGGGSITQQLARNLFTDRRATLYRKLYETFVAFRLERELEKEEILCLYLNKIYMGEGRIGAEEASWFYFRKPPWKLDAAEAAMIVGLFPSPVRYSPLNNIEKSLRKQKAVFKAMVDQNVIKAAEVDQNLKAFYKRYGVGTDPEDLDPGKIGLYGASRDYRINQAPSANEYVRSFLYANFDEELVRRGGLRVVTTVDPVRQRAALRAVRARVEAVRARLLKNEKVPPKKMERIARRLNGVLVSLDPRTGNIQAVVGGYEVTEGNMTNRVWEMKRQPGSAIKGFLYAVAIDESLLEPGQEVIDEKINYGGYSPRNPYRTYKGKMTLRSAVARSVNTVAVKTLDDLGVDRFRRRLSEALQLGYFESRERFPGSLSLALGTGEMTPLELARVHAMILNDGRTVAPRLVLKVITPDRRVIWEDDELPEGDSVLSPRACAAALYLLSGVTQDEEGTASWIGKRQRQKKKYLPFPVAGKSGTVQSVAAHYKKFPGMFGVHDAWFVGLAPEEATVVWVGHDEGAPFPGSGSGVAGSIWSRYAQGALPGRVEGEFPPIEVRPIEIPDDDPATELLENYQDTSPLTQDPPEPEKDPAPKVQPVPKVQPAPTPAPTPDPVSTDSVPERNENTSKPSVEGSGPPPVMPPLPPTATP